MGEEVETSLQRWRNGLVRPLHTSAGIQLSHPRVRGGFAAGMKESLKRLGLGVNRFGTRFAELEFYGSWLMGGIG